MESQSTDDERMSGTIAAEGLFPIVGLGASAGGLEALGQFLKNDALWPLEACQLATRMLNQIILTELTALC